MWLVLLALRRPYTFVCVAILTLVFGIVAIIRMPIDIFPSINVPVVSMLWAYGGLSPREMEVAGLVADHSRTPRPPRPDTARRVGIRQRDFAELECFAEDAHVSDRAMSVPTTTRKIPAKIRPAGW